MKTIVLTLVHYIFSVSAYSQIISTFAGNGIAGITGDSGTATAAKIDNPHFCVFDKFGNFYFSQYAGRTIRKINTAGIITTIVGTGLGGFGGDGGPASSATLKFPEGVACDTFGNLYIADHQNFRIRKVNIASGIITTFAGTGSSGDSGDGGPATAAELFPSDVCFYNNNLYVSDILYNEIRKIDVSGIITTYAGTGIGGFSGDGSLATSAQLFQPDGIAIDKVGNLYIADGGNKRIRKVDTFGIITTIAGTGIGLYSGDGIPATTAQFGPYTIAIDNNNKIYVSDSNQRIRMIDTFGIIHTVAGTGTAGYDGDGIQATLAQINNPGGIRFDACGKMYFSDILNNRIRKIDFLTIFTSPTISISGFTSASIGSTVTVTATVADAGSSYIIHWMNHGIEFTTTTIPSVTYTKPPGIDTITARVVSTATYGCYDSTTSAGHVVSGGTTSVAGLSKRAEVYVYPNPAKDEITVQGANDIDEVIVSNLLGQEIIYKKVIGKQVVINIEGLRAGVYVVKVNGVYAQKLIKE